MKSEVSQEEQGKEAAGNRRVRNEELSLTRQHLSALADDGSNCDYAWESLDFLCPEVSVRRRNALMINPEQAN